MFHTEHAMEFEEILSLHSTTPCRVTVVDRVRFERYKGHNYK